MQSRPSKCAACTWSLHEYSKIDFELFGIWNRNQLCGSCFTRCVVAFGEFECFETGVGKAAIASEDIYLLTNTSIQLVGAAISPTAAK